MYHVNTLHTEQLQGVRSEVDSKKPINKKPVSAKLVNQRVGNIIVVLL